MMFVGLTGLSLETGTNRFMPRTAGSAQNPFHTQNT